MNYSKKNKQNGFSLIELLFALTIFLVVLGAIGSAFISQRKSYSVQDQIAEMTQAARSATQMLSTEIRLAGYNPVRISGFTGIPYSASQLQLYADLNEDGDTLDANENIIYIYDSGSLRINRNDVNTEDAAYPFAENVEAFSVKYLKDDGVTEVTDAADNDEIRQIEITTRVRTSEPDPDFSTNSGYRTYTLTSRVTPVNLGL
ncbi:MAG: prepilin-type N-terminal cleavage/methylation domain-containing protein [Deltaproteobacteria bacterium]|nr:prepilin-type N-terminal cleavage/methylation domain-containing protein [Deltaproteobacteria bacterium]